MKTISFRKGEETGIVVENKDFDQSIFRDQYSETLDIIEKLETENEPQYRRSRVIAFCGERGSGKSSFLHSIRGILQKPIIASGFNKRRILSDNDFYVLETIDPSFFDERHNLIDLLLGQLYLDVEKLQLDEQRLNSQIKDKTDVLKHFQSVKRSLSIIRNGAPSYEYDELELTQEMAAAVKMQKEIDSLFESFLKLVDKKYLIISIDDLDLNLIGGYRMSEEIRKYLSISKHCIVLIALKVDQLVDVIKSAYRKEFNPIVDNTDIDDMAHRYVSKLLPISQRVWMPKGDEFADWGLQMFRDNSLEFEYPSVKEAVVRLIYRKTRYIFVNGAGVSPIVPTNLRELRHLIGLLWNLEDIDSEQDNLENKMVFKRYFYQTWTRCLNRDDKAFVNSIITNEDLVSINKIVVQGLCNTYLTTGEKDKKLKLDSLEEEIANISNKAFNVSVGDVYVFLRAMENLSTNQSQHNLIFFLRSFYSIRLYELYNEIVLDEKSLFVERLDNTPSLYKYDIQLQEQNNLQKFLNGAYFSYVPGQFLASEKKTGKDSYRDRRTIKANNISNKINYLNENLKNYGSNDTNLNKKYEAALNYCEFFALTTCGPTTSNETAMKRTNANPAYIQPYQNSRGSLLFDVLSIFYNIINIRQSYNKLNSFCKQDKKQVSNTFELYEVAKECPNSLLNKMMRKCNPRDNSNLDALLHGVISDATIRVSEVQMAIYDYLTLNRDLDKHKSSGENRYKLRSLYEDIQGIGIALYPIDSKEVGHRLTFNFLTPIIEYLNDVEENEFNKTFGKNEDEINNKEDWRSLRSNLLEIFGDNVPTNFPYPKTGSEVLKEFEEKKRVLFDSTGQAIFWGKIIKTSDIFPNWDTLNKAIFENARVAKHL